MKKMIGVMCLVATLGLVLAGCAKKEKQATPPATERTARKAAEPAAQQAATMAQHAGHEVNQVQATAQQTICPVMKGPIDKAIFVEYKGKKVYFCCADCKTQFENDPEKYIKDLPQFKP